jgi:hypothetical protein
MIVDNLLWDTLLYEIAAKEDKGVSRTRDVGWFLFWRTGACVAKMEEAAEIGWTGLGDCTGKRVGFVANTARH